MFSVGDKGALTLVEHELTRGQTPRNFALDPSGKWLIAANQRSGTLAVFSIDQTTGALTPVGPLAKSARRSACCSCDPVAGTLIS